MVTAATPVPLVGTWALLSMTYPDRDGKTVAPWGPAPLGRITYTADGRFSAVIAAPPRDPSSPSVSMPERQAKAFRNLGYAGTYALTGTTMSHHVEVATDPAWVGSVQTRHVAYDGRFLSLSTPAVATRRTITLVWEKLA